MESLYNAAVPKRLISLLLLPFPSTDFTSWYCGIMVQYSCTKTFDQSSAPSFTFFRFQVMALWNFGTIQVYQNV